MESSFSESYKAAGVDITAGYKSVELMKQHIAKTLTPGCVSDIGGFGGLFAPDLAGMKSPVLVSGTDGVGTKLKIAMLLDKHDTIGIDCVAMCVNDVICCGAKPLFFLDYIACGKNYPEKIAAIVSGVAEGCVQAGAALIGGETAEHPGMMADDDYDLAGFTVGIVDKEKIFDNKTVKKGDAIIALPSSGVHSNGFSLVRKVLDIENRELNIYCEDLGMTLGECLLTPSGGFYENIPRSIPKGFTAKIDAASLRIPPIFPVLQRAGDIPERDMFNTYNMGVGMSLVVDSARADEALEVLKANGEDAYIIGEITEGDEAVVIA